MSSRERLFLLDGMALAYRAYFAFISRPLLNSKGENTSAIYGFVTTLMKILEDEKPEHVAVVFDTKEPTFRHKKYAEYKATRQKMPEAMSAQMEKLKDVVRAFNTPILELPGYEADDIIGTLARRAEKESVTTYMVTGDKDFMQLISPHVKIYKPGKSGTDAEIIDESGVMKKFGVTPDKVTDVLGLIGDTSDNVPGVPGIGEKTAIPLIQKYGSLESLYEHVEEIPQKGLKAKLIDNREKAFLSKELVTIDTKVPIDADFHQLRAARRDTKRLMKMFGELEFRSLLGKLRESEQFDDAVGTDAASLPGDETVSFNPAELETIDIHSDEHTYVCVNTQEALDELAATLARSDRFVLDTETTSRDALRAALVGISVCRTEREAYYIPIQSDPPPELEADSLFGNNNQPGNDPADQENVPPASRPNPIPRYAVSGLQLGIVIGSLKPVLENPAIKKVGQNIKYDMLVLRNHGVEVRGIDFDTMVSSYVLRADGQHNLDALAMEYLGYSMIAFDDLVGKGRNRKDIAQVSMDDVTNYSAQDADITMRIYQRQLPQLKQRELLRLCEEVEFPLISVLARMECTGISLDTQYLSGMSKDIERQLDNLVSEIYRSAGEKFNINSTQQLGEVLFKKLQLPTLRKTKTGFSTDVNVLETLRGQHPIIEHLLEYRQLSKLKSTYIDALPKLINPKTGRVHTSFNQTVAATGRLSSSDPNLQNIPIRSEIGRAIRKAFVPGGKDMVLMSADYSQIELRVMAHVCSDEGLIEAFRNKEDIHASTAAKVFGVDPTAVNREMRRRAKEVNFGIMYGIGPFGLSNRLEISQGEAREIINRYFERFPKVKEYINNTISAARTLGYVSTLLGRRRYLPDINSRNQNVRGNAERQAINMPIQGSAADLIKVAMINIDGDISAKKLHSKMLLQVHDELVFEVPESEVAQMQTLVLENMQRALALKVPIDVEVGFGKNWLEAH